MSIFSRFPRRTVRLRLTLLCTGLFLASGTTLLAGAYVLASRGLAGPPGTRVVKDTPELIPAASVLPGNGAIQQSGTPEPMLLSDVRHQLLINFGVALVAMSVISVLLGWIVAGRILRPLRTITATVRDIAATDLHRRLALPSPDDELKELGDTFDGLLARLEFSFEAQRRFVADAAHELRAPLARQRALGQVALADPGASTRALRVALERILVAGARQGRLAEAMLTLTRGQAGIEMHEPFDLAHLTDEVLTTRQAEAEQRSVTVRPAISPALAAGHRGLAERLVADLVDNALRHNRPGGWIKVSTRTAGRCATLTVSNTGPEVSPDGVDELFQPFHRLGATSAAKADGLGLGLPIVRAIADAHEATVTATARAEGGLTVEVAFPGVSSRMHTLTPRPGLLAPGPTGAPPRAARPDSRPTRRG